MRKEEARNEASHKNENRENDGKAELWKKAKKARE
jgi:hypothetical protein